MLCSNNNSCWIWILLILFILFWNCGGFGCSTGGFGCGGGCNQNCGPCCNPCPTPSGCAQTCC